MNVKNVVKVMNFHSLLRVDRARKTAEKYFMVETELRKMIASITNNRNYILDKNILKPKSNAPVLNIYIGSDLGFCAGYNFVVNYKSKTDDADKIVIGKKLSKNMSNIKLNMAKDEYLQNHKPLNEFLFNAIKKDIYSEINIIYNRYINISNIEIVSKRLFPFAFDSEEFQMEYKEDFICESELDDLLSNMIAAYVDFETQIVVANSYASENIMRQNATNDSLKKIDEIEEEKSYIAYKKKMAIASQKTIESFIQLKAGKSA